MGKLEIQDFTKGNIAKQIMVFTWPLFLSNLLQVAYNMVDMIIVGHVLGKVGTSAVSVGGDVVTFMTFVAMGFSNAGQVLIARYIGAGQQGKIGRFVGTMVGFLVMCALCISTVALALQDPILQIMNTPAEAYEGALDYAVICMLGLVFIYGYNVVSAVLRGMGDGKHPFIFVGIAAVMNVVLDVLFVMGMDMGPGGAALATVISQGFSFVCCAVFLVRNRSRFAMDLHLREFIRWDREMLGNLVKLGIPMALKSAAVQFSKLFVNSWINSYGVVVSAFAGIVNKITNISNLVSNAMNTGGSTMVGQNIAAGQWDRVKQIIKQLLIISLIIEGLFALAVILFPDQVFGIFTSDPAVLEIGRGYVVIAAMLFINSALRAGINPLLNGSGNYRINMATALLDGIVCRIGFAVLFGLVLDMKYYGFWLGDALAGFTPFIVGMIFYWSGKWKKPVRG